MGLNARPIELRGGRIHNLKNVDVDIPRGQLVVVCGVSGSGKTSLAIDTLYAEGQRRFIEAFSPHARQFLQRIEKPDCDAIHHLPATSAIQRPSGAVSPRWTVGSITEAEDYLRLLMAKQGVLHCLRCQQVIAPSSPQSIADFVGSLPKERKILIGFELHWQNKQELSTQLFDLQSAGYPRVILSGKTFHLGEATRTSLAEATSNKGSGWVVVDRIQGGLADARVVDSIESAFRMSPLRIALFLSAVGEEATHSIDDRSFQLEWFGKELRCSRCELDYAPSEPDLFHCQKPTGMCPSCSGFGYLDREPLDVCPDCQGNRLSPHSLAYRLAGRNFAQLCQMDIDSLFEHFASIERDAIASNVGRYVWTDLKKRLQFVQKIGLGHLQLGRYANTLSTGELQRIHLTVAMSSSLTQMLYVLDDPTSGLHPSESEAIVEAMRGMQSRGNTVLVVSHDRAVLDAADFVIEMGPDAGERGGKVEFAGRGEQWRDGNSLTASFWSGKRGVLGRARQRRSPTGWLRLQGACGNNLKEPVVQIPLGVCCVVTGVSGSGKSSLVEGTLYEALRRLVSRERSNPLPFESLIGFESLRDVVLVDAQSIGRTPRSIPATALKLLDPIRDIFADTIDAKSRNLTSGYFSFNHALGKCRSCNGSGMQEVDMKFLADIQMVCPDCNGSRFCREALQARYRDRTIAEVLAMTAEQAIGFFRGDAKLQKRLQTMIDVGLHYLPIGQPGNQLSHGESQRLKLASILANAAHSNTLFIMDEPTAGLHFRDVLQLIDCFSKLLDHGNSLLIVDHHDQLLMSADHVIELGPGSASHGGRVVATGTPEVWLDHKDSWASRFLSKKIVV